MASYPIDLELTGREVVVVGLGAVGRRKVLGLIEAGARVRGVDPLGGPWAADRGIELRAEPFQATHLDGATLAIAAAWPEVNRRVIAEARARGILVSSASDPRSGDFTVPALWRSGPITLAVSTGGASPALAGTLRDRAARAIGPEAALLAQIFQDLRAEILVRITDPLLRRGVLQQAADPAWLDAVARDGVDATRLALRRALGLDEIDPEGSPRGL